MSSLRGPQQHTRSVELRRAERELFFWTAREALKLIVWLTLTIYLVVSIVEGRLAGLTDLLALAHKFGSIR